MNAEQAEKCAQIAARAEASGDVDKALRFLRKAQGMHPSAQYAAAISKLESRNNHSDEGVRQRKTATGAPSSPSASSPSRTASSASTSSTSSSSSSSSSSKSYTPENNEQVRRVLSAKDYYKVLNVEKGGDLSESSLKKAYRKLALKLHPDKNQAPRAEEAFKKVSDAYNCLKDPERRAYYDTHGTEDPAASRFGGGGGGRGGHAHFSRDPTPEELFNMFFGGDLRGGGNPFFNVYTNARPGRRARQHHHQQHQHHNQRQGGAMDGLMSLLPLLMLFLFTALSSYSGSGSDASGSGMFALRREQPFVEQSYTSVGVPFYTKLPVPQEFTVGSPSRSRIESEINRKAKREYFFVCQKEMQQKNKRVQRAKKSGVESRVRRERNMKMPHCEMYNKLVDAGV